jgi:hypothetical protein
MIKRRLLDVQSGYGNESKQRLRAIFSVIVFIEKMMREAEKLNNAFSIFCVAQAHYSMERVTTQIAPASYKLFGQDYHRVISTPGMICYTLL